MSGSLLQIVYRDDFRQGRRERVRAARHGRTGKGKGKDTKQRAWYAIWPLAASAVNTSHYLSASDSTEKDKSLTQHRTALTAGPVICTGVPPPL